jgi:prevent-host-death family protein
MKMGLREANQNFGKAIRAVKAGKVVVLTERGEPIATIQPLHKAPTEEDAIQQLMREGLLRPALEAGSITDEWKPLRVKGASLSKTLRQLRDEE